MRKRHLQGLSLVELLVAVVIISVSLVAFSQLYMCALWTHKKAQYQTLANKYAQYELEHAMSLGYTNYKVGAPKGVLDPAVPDTDISNFYTPRSSPTNDANFTYTYTVTNSGNTLANQFRRTVTFTLVALPGGTGTIEYTANPCIYNRGQDDKDKNLASVVVTIKWQGFKPNLPESVVLTSYIAQRPNQ